MNNNDKQLYAKIACLETKTDLLEAELSYLNQMLIRCGFPEGIKTLKETVEELLAQDPSLSQERSELI